MDAIIRQTVREEIRRHGESASTSSEAATHEPNQRTVSRLSGLLDRIRGQSRGKKTESLIKNIESKFDGFITTRSRKVLFQFVRRRVAETGALLILRQNLPQLKN